MDERIRAQLLRLNREFYQTFAPSFSETRQRLQPGVLRILETLPLDASVLDLGCSNGELARRLAARGHAGTYVGLDASPALLGAAREDQPHPRARFEEADLADPAWNALPEAPFDRIFAFATLHHLPGDALRRRVVQAVHDLLAEDGRAVISVWNFLASERLQARVVPWDAIELREQDVEPGDHLMDWRRGGYGLRYVHHFSPEELADLARRCGFAVEETFHSDGEGGKLGLYQVWAPASES
ncbi:MAG TPA: class I SAM-dependent methyltransferase [Anaerolineae bacterium]|nr:class I SAM-dependent methyltransferase [Anaerolineae bacterium]